jgi:hypothetical protein
MKAQEARFAPGFLHSAEASEKLPFVMICAATIAYMNTSRLHTLSSDGRHFTKIKTTNRFGLSKLNGPIDIMLPGAEI